ncbi:MAG: hypothetical protein JNM72_07105, partial [Deltaproteobacteria bacterium]|nr:hypothetical protein [Deltaproteobacteria bacterium]
MSARRAPPGADPLAAQVAALLGAPPPRAPRPPPRPPARVAPLGAAPQGPPRRRSGSLVCAGLLLPLPAWPPPPAAEGALRALLCAWAPGDRLLALPPPGGVPDGAPTSGGALLLRLGAPRRLGPQPQLDRLVEDGVGLSALDGEPCPLAGGALWAVAGARRFSPLPAAALDPAALIDLSGLILRAAPAVGPTPPLPAEEPPEPAAHRAARLGVWSVEGQAAIAAAAAGATGSGGGPGPAAQSRLGGLLAGLGGWLTRALLSARRPTPGQPPRAAAGALGSRFRSLPGWAQTSLSALAGVGLGAVALVAGAVDATLGRALRALRGLGSGRPAAAPAGPSLWARLQGALSAFAPLWRVWSKLSGAQTRYLNDLLRRFSDAASTTELLEALRHAIPLGGEAGGLERWLFGAAGPRTVGQLSAGRARSSVDVSAEVMGLLRRLYLDAHARLDAEGDVERAAWVLAELLHDAPGAVAYLERKGALALAARYAEALGQPLATCLRLWVAAGEPARAARLGLARGALGAAITALEGDHPAIAATLRRRHAAALLGLGDTRGAVAALWPGLARGGPEHRAQVTADLRA